MQRSGGSCSPPRECGVFCACLCLCLCPRCVRPRGLDNTVHRKVVMSSLCKRLCFALVKPATLPSDANKHTGHNRRIPGTDEDVNIESMICLICVRVWWFQGGVGGGG